MHPFNVYKNKNIILTIYVYESIRCITTLLFITSNIAYMAYSGICFLIYHQMLEIFSIHRELPQTFYSHICNKQWEQCFSNLAAQWNGWYEWYEWHEIQGERENIIPMDHGCPIINCYRWILGLFLTFILEHATMNNFAHQYFVYVG